MDDPQDKHRRKALEASSSIRFCYRSALLSAVIDTVTCLVEMGGVKGLTWLKAVALIRALHLVNFGAGLWQVSRVYCRALEKGKTLNFSSAFKLFKTMARVWKLAALVLILISMTTASALKEYMDSDVWTYAGPGGVLALALSGRSALQMWVAESIKTAVDAEKAPQEGTHGGKTESDAARSMGFTSAQNMANAMGGFYLLAVTLFLVTLAKPISGLALMIGMSDVMTPLAVAGLLGALNRSYLLAVVDATRDTSDVRLDTSQFFQLYEAQAGFYTKIGKTFLTNAVVKIVPHLIEAMMAMARAFVYS